jgi:hypothetical protein
MEGTLELNGSEVAEQESGAVNISRDVKNALSYVDSIRSNDLLAALYKENGGSNDVQLHGLAYQDFLTPPQIVGIFCDKYLSNKLKPIIIRTKKVAVGVSKVMVKIFDKNGVLLEKGLAKQFLQKEKWFYFVRKDFEDDQEMRIEAKAIDYPGNLAVFSQWIGLQ